MRCVRSCWIACRCRKPIWLACPRLVPRSRPIILIAHCGCSASIACSGEPACPNSPLRPIEYREPHFHYDRPFEGWAPQTSLFGYFQSERYFSSIAEMLRGWLLPREPFGVAAAEVLGQIERSRLPVSVHVRRGDYLNPATAEFHGILGEPYYRQAIQRIEAALGEGLDFFVFSDDAAAAEQVLNFVRRSHA